MLIYKYIQTIVHHRPIQIRYQLWYRIRKIWQKSTGSNYPFSVVNHGTPVKLQPWIEKPVSLSNETFTFLNIRKEYTDGKINWNEPGHGKLWAYNLNYMDFLHQPNIDKATGLQLMDYFIQFQPQNSTGLEPYPIALRCINWIKFLSGLSLRFSDTQHLGVNELNLTSRTPPDSVGRRVSTVVTTPQHANISRINTSLFAQYLTLLRNIEYHLLANHLLEDGFSLLFGAFYFNSPVFYNKAKQIIDTELNEQILDDGSHFELSPMYHQIILDRLLDCINLLQNNQLFDNQQKLLKFMLEKAQKMLTCLNNITFSNGEIPLLNDAAPDIAPTTQQLNEYASRLELTLSPLSSTLSASGYRKFTTPSYECVIDIGQIGPSYQPGHAHADTFNFVLNIKNKPVLVDTGISTYNTGKTRLKERGTAAHNTVTVKDKNSSGVWSSFRVAQRAKVKILKDEKDYVVAQHNGYKTFGTTHQREWIFSDRNIEITDTLSGRVTDGKAHFWFSPDANPIQIGNLIKIRSVNISFENAVLIELIPHKIPNGFNRFSDSHKLEITFKHYLETIISIE